MSASYDEDNDPIPFDVEDEIVVGDLTDQEGGVLPGSTRVVGQIRKASVKRSLLDNKYDEREDNPWTFKYLNLEIKIGEAGIDGEGAYAGKVIFTSMMDVILTYSPPACRLKAESKGKPFNAEWWAKTARLGAKQFFIAINGSAKDVKVNDEVLTALVGQVVMFDIKKEKDGTREGEFSNRLTNWRTVETSEEE